ncbi:MAG: VIT1/CCC1 transporter family protein [Candidatus Manganitrophus sp.]|nr:VIT1/CCC1 transporter family protein [Candidatus Manganitrophus sp.]MDC4227128.1 VIT1/CCC1 transporter family protein [Candidatus Manganitrophus sp.]WDT71737.1 MAG: VIT1/CCC1 transporter family protein [Candidatus Manganitrophus sp.]WDT80891.1 MAG: VIT1/CCC1 transporter family protein [Candidatus Manganitrophus sp.]
MQNVQTVDPHLARQLVLDELFDLMLYRKFREISGPELHPTLDELIKVEGGHLAFWQSLFGIEISELNPARRFKLQMIVLVCRLFGAPAIDLILEAIEIHGIRKYLTLWKENKDNSIGKAVRGVLEDEFKHEDAIVSRLKERIINPDRIRNIFLGLNDGMVEILGAVSGFFASFGQNSLVLLAGLTTAVAGSLSMAAGAYVAVSSENEVRRTQEEKARFLVGGTGEEPRTEPAIQSAAIVGVSYFIGASFPLLPVIFGAHTALWSILTAGTIIILVSMALAFLSGMDVKRRALTNLVIITVAAGVTYLIGMLVRNLLGIEI